MDVSAEQRELNMIRKLYAIYCLLVIVIIPSHICVGEETTEDNYFVNYTAYPTYIEFETEYDDYNVTDISCDLSKPQLLRTSRELFTCQNLQPCTTYLVTAKIKFPDDTIHSQYQSVTTGYEEPSVHMNDPMPFTDSIYLYWNTKNPNCIKEIKIEAVSSDGQKETIRILGQTTDVTIENLLPCQMYSITMTVTDINAEIVGTQSLTNQTDYVDPGPVQNVVCNVTENSVIVSWDLPTHPTCTEFYYFLLRTDNCDEADLCGVPYNLTSTEKQLMINDLEGCQNYVLKISVNGETNSTSIENFSTSILDPGSVVSLNATSLSSTSVSLLWSPPNENHLCVEYYSIKILNQEDTYNSTDLSFTFDNLSPCAKYSMQVAAVALNGMFGPWESISITMDHASPSVIRNNNVISYPYEIKMTWDPPSFATLCIVGYEITVEDEDERVQNFKTVDTFFVALSLNSCMTYSIGIVAVTNSEEHREGDVVQITATTAARVVEIPENKKEINTEPLNNGIYIHSRNTDETNNCKVLYVRFTCDSTTPDAEIMHGELTIPFTQPNHFAFTGTVTPLSPAIKYICKAFIYNVEGWSGGLEAFSTTLPDYPGPPQVIALRQISPSSISIKWQAPRYKNGILALYHIHIQTIGPKYHIPGRCEPPKSTDITDSVAATVNNWVFTEALPCFEYSVQIAARNEVGVGVFSSPVSLVTNTSRSDPVEQFDVSIQGPALSEMYRANVTLSWPLPCYTHGPVIAFEGYFVGERQGYEQEYYPWSLQINDTDTAVSDSFEWFENRLKPQYDYSVTIMVLVADAPDSVESKVEFTSPAGIPPMPNITYNSDVDVFLAPNPTESAYVRFSTNILNPEMGDILYIALLVSEQGCQNDPSPQMALINSETNWPNIPSWYDVQIEACIKQYQTTPERWAPPPIPVTLDDTKAVKIIEYTVGNENCQTSKNRYCNGALIPGVNYALVVRLFTSAGYTDTNSIYFRTDSKIEIYFVLLMILSCLIIAFLLGFLYLWITKKIVWHGEPFIGNEEHTGDVTSKNFLEYYEEIVKTDKLNREFKELTAISNELNLSNVASTSNETKNRYSNVFPYDKNRVMLDCDSDGADYINASFINGYKRRKEYIATQGPKPETYVDFWRMIVQYNVRLVVMVTQFREGETIKCNQYFPFINKEMRVGHNITVTCKKETHFENYVRRELQVEHISDYISRTVVHYLFRKWPDHDCPDDVTHLIEFVRKVKTEKIPRHSPIVVHCSAGVGRTGTFIGLDIIMQRLKSENRISIYDTVKQLRFQRMKMVQTIQQYQFLYKCAHHLVKKKHTSSTKRLKKKANEEALKNAETSNDNGLNPINGNGVMHSLDNGRSISRTESIM